MFSRNRWMFCLVALILGHATAARASLVTYTISGTGTFDVGATIYFNAPFVFTATADTDNIIGGNLVHVDSLTLDYPNGPTATFEGEWDIEMEKPSGFFRIVDLERSIIVIGITSPALSSYGLDTPIGPIDGLATRSGNLFRTDQGGFGFRSSSSEASFQASLSAVPEPSTLALGFVGLVAGIARLRRREARLVA